MKTDSQLVRELMNSVIDACEAVENLEISASEADSPLLTSPATVWDALQSSWIYPENVQFEVIGARYKLGNEKHFTPESARALVNAAKVCAELIGAGEDPAIQLPVRKLAHWYPTSMVAPIATAMAAKRQPTGNS